jgi:cytochrome c oxidase subunit 2
MSRLQELLERVKSSRFAKIGVVGLASLGLSACRIPSLGAYHGDTTQGNSVYHLWEGFVVASFFVGGITFALLIYAIVRYRRRGDTIPKQVHGNTALELTYTIIPLLIVAVLFFFTVRVENKVDAVSAHPNLRVDVTAYQWGWKFYYPKYHVTSMTQSVQAVENGQLPVFELPVGETATIRLVSNDVVHGFSLSEFDFSRYALPGVTNYFDFTPTHTADFIGRCTHLCGLYHAQMIFDMRVVTPTQFMAWIHAHQGR